MVAVRLDKLFGSGVMSLRRLSIVGGTVAEQADLKCSVQAAIRLVIDAGAQQNANVNQGPRQNRGKVDQ
jgi:hypothetical protein